jgi:hypothetical protein
MVNDGEFGMEEVNGINEVASEWDNEYRSAGGSISPKN